MKLEHRLLTIVELAKMVNIKREREVWWIKTNPNQSVRALFEYPSNNIIQQELITTVGVDFSRLKNKARLKWTCCFFT